MSETVEFALLDLCDIEDAEREPISSSERAKISGPYAYYGASGIIDHINTYRFSHDTVLISEDGENLNSRQTPIAFRATGKYWVNNHAHVLRPKREHYFPIISNYLRHLDLSPFITGAVQPKLSQENLARITLPLPALEEEQRAIAGVLSSLDEKIDLLTGQNKTLETMAQVLWRTMFVDDADQTWTTGELRDIGELRNGINYTRDENGDTQCQILNVRDIVASKYGVASAFEKVMIDGKKAGPYLLHTGDIVIVRSASPGESLIVLEEISDFIYSGFSIRLRCHDRRYAFFTFHFLQSYKRQMDVFSDGTTLKNINQQVLGSVVLSIPAAGRIEEFNSRVTNMYHKMLLNLRQVRTLSRLRDMLLPKLMSGEVKVRL